MAEEKSLNQYVDYETESWISVCVIDSDLYFICFLLLFFCEQGQPFPGLSSVKSMQYCLNIPAGRGQFTNRSSSATLATNVPSESGTYNPLIGRKVMTRWPEDNNFYEAVITDYNPLEVCSQFWKCFWACLNAK